MSVALIMLMSPFVASSVSGFIHKIQPFACKKHPICKSRPQSPNRGMTMYFDDISRGARYTVPWHPSGNELKMSCGYDAEKKIAKEKADAIKRFITGHDVESASLLSDEDVRGEIMLWVRKSGLVGRRDETYGSIIGIDICSSTSLVGSVAGFWRSVVGVIEENADPHYPADIWKTDDLELNQLHMIVYPTADLYDYSTMTILNALVEFCRDSCKYLGRKFTLTHFHPKFKNSPPMMSPTRHSPFPCLGLHFAGENEEINERLMERSKSKQGNSRRTDSDYIPSLRERRRNLEKIFNSAAAPSSVKGQSYKRTTVATDNLSPKDKAIELTKDWIKRNRCGPLTVGVCETEKDHNWALRFADTVGNRWAVTNAKTAEEVYAEIWSAISDLCDLGAVVESRHDTSDSAKAALAETPLTPVLSTMFISTDFCAFNASKFKRFAVTVNAALKHLTGGKVFLEVFHPEYMGKKGYQNDFRRAPFPTIQICVKLNSV